MRTSTGSRHGEVGGAEGSGFGLRGGVGIVCGLAGGGVDGSWPRGAVGIVCGFAGGGGRFADAVWRRSPGFGAAAGAAAGAGRGPGWTEGWDLAAAGGAAGCVSRGREGVARGTCARGETERDEEAGGGGGGIEGPSGGAAGMGGTDSSALSSSSVSRLVDRLSPP